MPSVFKKKNRSERNHKRLNRSHFACLLRSHLVLRFALQSRGTRFEIRHQENCSRFHTSFSGDTCCKYVNFSLRSKIGSRDLEHLNMRIEVSSLPPDYRENSVNQEVARAVNSRYVSHKFFDED